MLNNNCKIFLLGLWQTCLGGFCTSRTGGRPAALAISV